MLTVIAVLLLLILLTLWLIDYTMVRQNKLVDEQLTHIQKQLNDLWRRQ